VFGFQANELFRINESELVDIEHLLPLRMHRPVGVRADEPMQAGFKGIVAPVPARRQAADGVVLFDDLDLIAAFARVDGGAQSGNAGTDNDNLSRRLTHPRHPQSQGGGNMRPVRGRVVDSDQSNFNVFPALKGGDFHCWRRTFSPDTENV